MAADLIITFGILAGLLRSRTDWERTNRVSKSPRDFHYG